ncbi:hypothetical protein ACEPAG_5801 [Sanghuangporus baumii]
MAQTVEYRQVGKSGLRISVPIIGTMGIGSQKWTTWVIPEEEAMTLLKAAWDSGLNTIDTANMYSNGESESAIKRFIEKFEIPREKLVIMDKIYNLVASDVATFVPLMPGLSKTRDYVNQGGLSRTAIINQVDACLFRLGTTYIDLLQVHTFDPTTPIEETMKTLHDLVTSGKVRYIGASNMRAWQVAEMNNAAERNGWTQFISMQVEHSLLYRTQEVEMFAYCNHKGMGIFAYSPLMDGHLARPDGVESTRSKSVKGSFFEKKRRESDKEIIRRVEELAKKHAWKMSQVALAWSATKVCSPIVGANSLQRLQESMTTGKALTAEEVKYLEEPYEYQPYRW